MKFLLDTNIILELILEQTKAEEVRALLEKADQNDFFISDFSLHSIGLLLFRRKLHHIFSEFLTDMLIRAGVIVMTLSSEEMESVINAALRFNLDFDDAYQYVSAEKYDLTILSFDSDFDRTEHGRKTPSEVLIKK